jgi:hypothetical protein
VGEIVIQCRLFSAGVSTLLWLSTFSITQSSVDLSIMSIPQDKFDSKHSRYKIVNIYI